MKMYLFMIIFVALIRAGCFWHSYAVFCARSRTKLELRRTTTRLRDVQRLEEGGRHLLSVAVVAGELVALGQRAPCARTLRLRPRRFATCRSKQAASQAGQCVR